MFVFENPSSLFFSKRKTWHETEIECHDSLSNQSSSIFKEVEIGIFFILVSFLSTTKKSLSAERYQDDHYITWQLSKKHSDKKVTSFRYVSDFYNMDWTEEENDFLDPLEPFFVAHNRFFVSFNLPLVLEFRLEMQKNRTSKPLHSLPKLQNTPDQVLFYFSKLPDRLKKNCFEAFACALDIP